MKTVIVIIKFCFCFAKVHSLFGNEEGKIYERCPVLEEINPERVCRNQQTIVVIFLKILLADSLTSFLSMVA